jgi:hypothetical protein
MALPAALRRRDRVPPKECGSRPRGYTLRTTMALPLRKDTGSLRRELGRTRPMAKTALRLSTIFTTTMAAMTAIQRRTLHQPPPRSLISTPCPRNGLEIRLTGTCNPASRSKLSVDQAGTPRSEQQSLSPTCATRRRPCSRWQATFLPCPLNIWASNHHRCPTVHTPIKGNLDRLLGRVYPRAQLHTDPGCSLLPSRVLTRTVFPRILHPSAQDSCPAR